MYYNLYIRLNDRVNAAFEYQLHSQKANPLCLHDVFFIVFCRQGTFEWFTIRSYTFWSGISQKR